MLDFASFVAGNWGVPSSATIFVFNNASPTVQTNWETCLKPRGSVGCYIYCVGGGGGGMSGLAGAASFAGGGGGGGSSGQSTLWVPAFLLPDVLYVSVGAGGASNVASTNAIASKVSVAPSATANDCLLSATGGASGTAPTTVPAGGGAGAAGGLATIAQAPLAGWGASNFLAGQAGIIGGAAVAGGNLALPTTGLVITGATGGGGLGAVNVAGKAGGNITGAGIFPSNPGGAGGTTAPTAGAHGSNGMRPIRNLWYMYGATGGGSCGLTAGGVGADGGSGQRGSFGCGGGGGGACITGSTPGRGGEGGDGIVIIAFW